VRLNTAVGVFDDCMDDYVLVRIWRTRVRRVEGR
jgi:hypothetical protein